MTDQELRHRIENILRPKFPHQHPPLLEVVTWEVKYTKDGMNIMVDEIIELITEVCNENG